MSSAPPLELDKHYRNSVTVRWLIMWIHLSWRGSCRQSRMMIEWPSTLQDVRSRHWTVQSLRRRDRLLRTLDSALWDTLRLSSSRLSSSTVTGATNPDVLIALANLISILPFNLIMLKTENSNFTWKSMLKNNITPDSSDDKRFTLYVYLDDRNVFHLSLWRWETPLKSSLIPLREMCSGVRVRSSL